MKGAFSSWVRVCVWREEGGCRLRGAVDAAAAAAAAVRRRRPLSSPLLLDPSAENNHHQKHDSNATVFTRMQHLLVRCARESATECDTEWVCE